MCMCIFRPTHLIHSSTSSSVFDRWLPVSGNMRTLNPPITLTMPNTNNGNILLTSDCEKNRNSNKPRMTVKALINFFYITYTYVTNYIDRSSIYSDKLKITDNVKNQKKKKANRSMIRFISNFIKIHFHKRKTYPRWPENRISKQNYNVNYFINITKLWSINARLIIYVLIATRDSS